MNPHPAESPRWSRRQWCYAIGAAIVIQVGLVFFFDGEPQPRPLPLRSPANIYAAVDPWSAQFLDNLSALSDPTLFALPNLKGFSGSAWLRFAPLEHRLSDWTTTPCWLALDQSWLSDSFAALVATNVTEPLLIGDKPLPRPTGLDVPIPNEPFATQSVLRVEGELAGRPLLSSPDLPAWSSSELLSNTVVQLLVDADGYPLATALLAESGSKEADQFALKLATAARFTPLRPPDYTPHPRLRLAWGKLICQWATLVPPVTNAAGESP